MNTKILEKGNFILIKDNIEFIKKHLYTYFDKTKTHISIITHVKDSVIVINIKNNTKGDEISWIVINGSGNNTTINNHFKASLFKFSKHKTTDENFICDTCDNYYCEDCSYHFKIHYQFQGARCYICADQYHRKITKEEIRDNKIKLIVGKLV